jgi:CDP-2,3-bis-(O-geranylgeranyl)-sn-glycerol synthase
MTPQNTLVIKIDIINEMLIALWFIYPAYVANGSAIILGRGKPLDFGKKFRGKRILGNHKSIVGFLGAIIVGASIGYIQESMFGRVNGLIIGAMLGLGAMLGDCTKSFIKRQRDMKPGSSLFPLDQLDFIIGGLLFAIPFEIPSITTVLLLLFLTPVAHVVTNYAAYRMRLKKVWW